MRDGAACVGVLGGVGPRGTARLYLEIVQRLVAVGHHAYPDLLLYSMPVPLDVEGAFVAGRASPDAAEQITAVLDRGFGILRRGGATHVALACNTLQHLGERLSVRHELPFVALVPALFRQARDRGIRKLALIGSGSLRDDVYYAEAAARHGVEIVLTSPAEQRIVNEAILLAVTAADDRDADRCLGSVLPSLASRADGVALACTDLAGMLRDALLPVIDSVAVLADRVVAHLHPSSEVEAEAAGVACRATG